MEGTFLKLMAQLGLIAVIVWIIAGALGKREQVQIKRGTCDRSQRMKNKAQGNKWMPAVALAPEATQYANDYIFGV